MNINIDEQQAFFFCTQAYDQPWETADAYNGDAPRSGGWLPQ
jgi:hypothetical protein